jgi:hypothetical protein
MAIIPCLTSSFKSQILAGVHVLTTDELKIALFGPTATLGPDTKFYSSTGEIGGFGYTLGGQVLSGVQVVTDGTTVIVDFDNPSWTFSSTPVQVCGALVYNASRSNRTIMVMAFGPDFYKTGTWSLNIPEPTALTGIIRIN